VRAGGHETFGNGQGSEKGFDNAVIFNQEDYGIWIGAG
jgi:hypothetical protein